MSAVSRAPTRQGNRAGRGAVVELRSAALSGEFGMTMLRAKFPDTADAILARLGVYSRGPRKGQPRGYIHWLKVVEGGYDYARRRVLSQRGAQEWRVLENASNESRDIGAELANEAAKEQYARDDAAHAAMTKKERWLSSARATRLGAHTYLRAGNVHDFKDLMSMARRCVKHARDAGAAA